MTTVYLYGGSGTYTGESAFEGSSPSIGSTHKFILFLAARLFTRFTNIVSPVKLFLCWR